MTKDEARQKAAKLFDSYVGEWKVGNYINSGKSAFVCEAFKEDKKYAIKIFDSDVIDHTSKEELQVRIDRQLDLINQNHENLIKIYGGGFCSNCKHYFIVMEYIDAPNLGDVLKEIPRDEIGLLITQIANAAKYLEDLGIVHRDIKPENIIISKDFKKVVLLDLGVIRPVGVENVTDSSNNTPFLGTLRYSSPEYLLRKEKDTLDGWRALTFYQIGAVLHDLIMQYPIFNQHSLYSRLVIAVQTEIPKVLANDIDQDLIRLVNLCLMKDPELRYKHLSWEDFIYPKNSSNLESVKARIQSRIVTSTNITQRNELSDEKLNRQIEQLLYDINYYLQTNIREICIGSKVFPSLKLNDQVNIKNSFLQIIISFNKSIKHKLNVPFKIFINVNILDLNSKLIQINGFSLLHNVSEISSDITKHNFTIFEGVFTVTESKKDLESFIFTTFDKAQMICENHSNIECFLITPNIEEELNGRERNLVG